MNILVVEDEVKVANLLRKGLEEEGYTVSVAKDGQEGLHKAESGGIDLLLLDVNLPIINGLDLCRLIRSHNSNIPVLMLTALGMTNDVVAGLDAGADDYLAKPFKFEELKARIRALTRRQLANEHKITNSSEVDDIFELADLRIDFNAREVRRAGHALQLTAREYALLCFLARNKGKVKTRLEIAQAVWDLHFDTGTNFIDVYISYIRNKIDKNMPVKLIHTVVGIGYVLREPEY